MTLQEILFGKFKPPKATRVRVHMMSTKTDPSRVVNTNRNSFFPDTPRRMMRTK